jgi:ABC-type phosphate transport system substrate-binding protein
MLAFVERTNNAIGYIAVHSPANAPVASYRADGSSTSYPDVSVISIGTAKPTTTNVQNGSYHFTAVEHLYMSPEPSKLAQGFLAYLTQYLMQHASPDFLPCSSTPKLAAECAASS